MPRVTFADGHIFTYELYPQGHFTIDGRELQVVDYRLYRDGGTTIITTSEGELYIPTPFRPEMKTTWTPS